MLEHDEVEPAATSTATSGRAVFAAYFLQVFAYGLQIESRQDGCQKNIERTHVELLGGERTTADTRSVGFDDADDLSDELGGYAESGAYAADGGGGRCDVWVRSEVEVEHEGVGAFDEDFLARGNGFVDVDYAVDHVGAESVC